jgi:hypothetical protein
VPSELCGHFASEIGPGHAIVIHGASGSVKTYLMAEAADREAHALSSLAGAIIVRFLRTSAALSNLTDLLGSIWMQPHAISPNATRLPGIDAVEDLKEYFETAMKALQTGRVIVFLDSLDLPRAQGRNGHPL